MNYDELLQDKRNLEAERANAIANVHRVDGAIAFVNMKLAELDKASAEKQTKETDNGTSDSTV